jgi:uncharacterized protein YbcC (UPF0753/DUF2309 family)
VSIDTGGRIHLEDILADIAELLPTQGPIDVFIHHNTLHAFEHLPFEEAVHAASKVYGAEAFLPEQRYLEEFRNGRIAESDLDAVLSTLTLDAAGVGGHSFAEVLTQFLIVAPPVESFQEVKWMLRESRTSVRPQGIAPEKLHGWLNAHLENVNKRDALHHINYDAAEGLEEIVASLSKEIRVNDSESVVLWAAALLLSAEVYEHEREAAESETFALLDELCNPILIRFCEEYLDLGFSNQLMPARGRGMLACFLALIDSAHFAVPGWLRAARKDLSQLGEQGLETRGWY